MLQLSAITLAVAAIAGIALFAIAPRFPPAGRIWLPGAAHGICGALGFLLLLAALGGAGWGGAGWGGAGWGGAAGGAARGAAAGAADFGVLAAWLIGAGLLLGGCVFALRLRRRGVPSVVIGVHATLAVAGLVLLSAYLALG